MKTVVITGGSDGLGKALAEKLAKDHQVIILARSEKALQEVATKAGCGYVVCDVRDAKQVSKAFAEIIQKHDRIDVLINNAGVIVNGELVDTSDEDIENVITTNTLGSIYVAKAALRHMKEQRSGLIVNVVSQAGLIARANRSIYNASKWALTGFTKALQQETAEYGVRVTGFYPGTIKTDLFTKAGIEMKGPAITTEQAVKSIEFLLSCDEDVLISELGIKHLEG
ncbi:MAG TPA: SDR family oxidoreductase [Candidatus Saccharimonadales bacterium]|nr:SDR family oxidoreductase [Candidatus Saccharimonadales bacterium]